MAPLKRILRLGGGFEAAAQPLTFWGCSASGRSGPWWSAPVEVPGRVAGARWCPALISRPSSSSGGVSGVGGGGGGGSVQLYFTESSACWHCEAKECEAYVKKLNTLVGGGGGGGGGGGAG